jgi:hypothetical protein
LSALPSMFGLVSGAGLANARSDSRIKGRQNSDIRAFSLSHVVYSLRNPKTSSEGRSQAALAPYPRIYARSVRLFIDVCFCERAHHIPAPWFLFRLSLMGSTFTLVWFVLVQILLYGSAYTCQRASPHLWWLTFGVLSVMYYMILKVVVVAILVFVVGPILFVRYNCSLSFGLLKLTSHSYFGASSYSVSADIHHKTHTMSHRTSSKSHGPLLINYTHPSPQRRAAASAYRSKGRLRPLGRKASTHSYSSMVTAPRARFACSTFKHRSAWA